ncbi:MAG TPA: ATP synthase A1 subunit C [Candidatus Nanoarchaeia archaeon]|nr:ATP synthase A1 subunit C [Candidatus Nanoarchaeia archaeon]
MDFSLMMETEKKPRKLKLGEAPYTYARIAAMRSKLIKKDEYNRLMKMKLNDILRFLQETEYRKEIDEMAVSYSGIELVELALNKNLVKTFLKLKRIAEYGDLRLVMAEYMNRRDVWNIKTILRGKSINEKEDKIRDLLIPIGELDQKFFDELLKKESVEDVIRSLKLLTKEQAKEAVEFFSERKSLFVIENTLDNLYYSKSIEFSRQMPKQGAFFRNFIENEIDVLNIRTILKLKKEGMQKKDIEKFIFYSGARLKKHDLLRLARAEDIDSMMGMLNKMGYEKILKDVYDKSKKDITKVELRLNRYLLDRVILLLHQHPLSIDVILGYMFAKEIEIRNLRTLIKGRQLGLKDEFIENELVVGG